MAFGKRERQNNNAESNPAGRSAEIPYPSGYVDPGPPPSGMRARRKWRRLVKRERKKLRKDLKKRGIRSKTEFEQIAWELGLILDNGRKAGFLAWFYWFLSWLKTSAGLKTLIGAAAALLASIFLLSYITDLSGAFTINLTTEMMRGGFFLSDTIRFEEPTSRLISEKMKDVVNITLEDIDRDVDDIDGPHNGDHYVAYTFYIKNDGYETKDYRYALLMNNSTLRVDKAVWLMLYEDGHQIVYASPSADGDEEKLIGYEEPPFYDDAYDPDRQYYRRDSEWGIKTTAFVDENTVAIGLVKDVDPGEVHKYTVVIWLEGNDPECTDEIFGGFAKYSMEFDIIDEEDDRNIFSGIWRTEYEDYANGMIDIEEYD